MQQGLFSQDPSPNEKTIFVRNSYNRQLIYHTVLVQLDRNTLLWLQGHSHTSWVDAKRWQPNGLNFWGYLEDSMSPGKLCQTACIEVADFCLLSLMICLETTQQQPEVSLSNLIGIFKMPVCSSFRAAGHESSALSAPTDKSTSNHRRENRSGGISVAQCRLNLSWNAACWDDALPGPPSKYHLDLRLTDTWNANSLSKKWSGGGGCGKYMETEHPCMVWTFWNLDIFWLRPSIFQAAISINCFVRSKLVLPVCVKAYWLRNLLQKIQDNC